MASRNSVKIYLENSYYHIYNRGVEQRTIFIDEQDYSVFLSYLKTYLQPKEEYRLKHILATQKSTFQEKDKAIKLLKLKNYFDKLELICYALLPNHFHLLVWQANKELNSFMNSLGTRYAMYFNRKYKRKGVLFQDVYKAVLIETDEQLLHLSRYIHLNPIRALGLSPHHWQQATFPSSLSEYLGKRQTNWVKKERVLNYFSQTKTINTYEEFMGLQIEPSILVNTAIDFEE